MADQDIDLDALRRVAEAATPTPWELFTMESDHSQYAEVCGVITEDVGDTIADCHALTRLGNERHAKDDGEADARHIATFDPPTVLALIARVEQAERERNDLRRAWDVHDTDCAAVEKNLKGTAAALAAAEERIAVIHADLATYREDPDTARVFLAEGIDKALDDLRAALGSDGPR